MLQIGLLMYFGAFLIPLVYLLLTAGRGSARRPLLIGIGLQIFWSLAVWAYVYFSWWAGYEDFWMGWGLLLPVNAIGLLYFLAVIFIFGFKKAPPPPP